MATRKWLPVVVGIVIFVIIVGIGLIGGLVYVVTRQVQVQTLSSEGGRAEFDRMRASFDDQQPFIELPAGDAEGQPTVHRELEKQAPGKIGTIHMRVWEPREGKLVRLDLPFWTVRMMGSKPITFRTNDSDFGGFTLKVTAEDIERRGPGLILDHGTPRGERVLIWTD
jgi:hypothetical protein